MKQVFSKTEYFWIDFGIVSLWRHFLEHYPDKATSTDGSSKLKADKFYVELKPECLVIEGERKAVDDELRKMVGSLKEAVWREKARKEGKFWWSGIAQFFFRQQNKPASFLVTPSEMVSAKWRKGVCDFCGRSDLRVQSIRTSENPLIVKFKKMRSFYSSLRGDLKICKNCTFASHFVASKAFFNINQNFLNVFVVQGIDFVDVDKFVDRLSDLYDVGEAYRNYPSILYYVQYPLENFLGFLMSIWDKLGKRNLITYEETLRGKCCHIIHAKRKGNFVTIEHCYVIPDIYKILRILGYMEWQDRTGKSYNAVTPVLNSFFFRRNKKLDTTMREELCRRLLYGADVLSPIEGFLHDYVLKEDKVLSGFRVRNFRVFIKNYETKVMKMEEETLKNCESLGGALGRLTIKTNDKSILYALRSTRSFDDFLAAFYQVFMRYLDEIHVYRRGVKDLLKGIDERNWKRHRALIGIYAVLTYMEAKQKKKKRR